jgi:hypothetical protein
VWLCFGYLRDVVMLWVFMGCGYAMGILRDVVILWVFKDVVMLWVF